MDLQVFNYEESQIRTSINDKGETLFVAKDVCDVLGISKYRDAISKLDEDEACRVKVDTLGGNQEMSAITESGLYSLIFSSNKDEARKFRKWVTSEVLPNIRKTGSYSVTNKMMPLHEVEREMAAAIRLVELFGISGNQAKLSAMTTMKKYHNVNVQELVSITHLVSEHQEHDFTPTQLGQQIGGKTPQQVNKLLVERGFQKKVLKDWIPTEEGRKYAIYLDTAKKHTDGTPVKQIKWRASILDRLK